MSIVLKDGTVLPDIPTAYTDDRFIGVAPDLATLKYHDVFFNSYSGIYFLTCSAVPAVCAENNGNLFALLLDSTLETSEIYTTFQFLPDSGANSWTEIYSGLVTGGDYNWLPPAQGNYVWVDYDINFIDPITGELGEIYFPSSVVSKPPFVLPDGTELPALPDGCFDGTPYGMIASMEGVYYLLATASSVFAETYLGSEDYSWYPVYPSGKTGMWMASDGKWELVADVNYDAPTEGPPVDLYPICWVNHDILFATKNDDGSYTIGTEIARKSDENYRVTGGYMTSIANEGRRLGSREGELKPAELEDALRNAESGKDLPNGEETTFGYVFEGGVETVYVYAGFDNVPKEAQQLHFVICKNRKDEYRLEARELKFYAKLYDDAYYRLETYGGKSLSYMLRDGVWVEESTTGWINLMDWPTIVYSTDNISNSSGGYLATAGTPEIREGTVGSTTPVLREAEYRMTSDTMNRMCYIAQMAAGRQDLMLPDTALDILENSAGVGGGGGSGNYVNGEELYF